VDPTLSPYLHASGEDAEQCLATLLSGETDRAIRAIVSRTLCGSARGGRTQTLETEDVRADVMVHLLERLRRLKSPTEQAAIENFPAYVASIAYRTCYTHLRRLYPQRARLKNRLRYALTYDPDLTIEQDALGIWRCGLTVWMENATDTGGISQPAALARDTQAVERFRREPGVFAREVVPDPAAGHLGIGETVKALLERIGEPVDLDLLIDGIGGVLGVDSRALWMSTRDDDGMHEIADPTTSVAQTLAFRQYLGRLWTEVLELPLKQRVAILLNLRDEDGGAALPLLPLIGVATIRQIADVLDMPALELAALWRSLPLDDTKIAARLELTRQQIINLRKSGRERLGRRMARYGVV
jgi:DNA-directed RNA polymerase specialized sigma24 family protein